MTKRMLAVVGAMLYACEGTKMRRDNRGENRYIYSVEFTNNNPKIIAIFIKFLREIINIDPFRLRGQLFIYPDHDPIKIMNYWSAISKISLDQFQKPIVLPQKTSKFKPSQYGTFKIRYSSKKDFLKIQKLMDLFWREAGIIDC